jgi:hypothetical protein
MTSDKNPSQRTSPIRRGAKENANPKSGTRWIPCEQPPFEFEMDNTPRAEIVEHALQVIREYAPQEFQAKREALHRALLGPYYRNFVTGFSPMGEEVDPALKPVVRAARKLEEEGIKDTFEQLKQAVEAKIRTDHELEWSDRAKEATWKPSQLRKIPGMRAEARRRLEEGGDPAVEHRVTEDLQLENGLTVPGTVSDGWLANGEPRSRQGPQVTNEDARQILFELTEGTLGLPLDPGSDRSASSAVRVLLLLYVGERTGHDESLSRWWERHRRRTSS